METLHTVQPYTIWDLTQHGIVYPSDILYLNEQYIVVDQYNHRIVWLDKNGVCIRSLCAIDSTRGIFRYPTSLCTDDTGSIWITDRWNHCIRQLSHTGELLSSFGTYGTQSARFSEPWGIDFFAGTLVISDRNNHRIQIFDTHGNFISAFGTSGPDKDYYESVDFKRGFIYEHWNSITHKFLTFDTLFYENEYTIGTFEYPQNLSIAPSGNIAVVDNANDRIQILSPSGTPIQSITANDLPNKKDFFTDILFIDNTTLLLTTELHNAVYRHHNNHIDTCYTLPGGRLNYISKDTDGNILALDTWHSKLAFFKQE